MNTRILHQLTKQLELVDSYDDVRPLCEEFCNAFEFEHYLFAVCTITSLSAPQVTTISNYPEDWLKMYFDQSMQKDDPVVKYCFTNTEPVRWDELMHMEEYMSPEGERIMAKAIDIGLLNGISIPLNAPGGKFAILSLATSNILQVDERMLNVLPYAQSFSVSLLEAFSRIDTIKLEASSNRLTPREIECLFWACEGKTTWEIAKIVDISERTIIFHLTSATKKLGAANRQHAVAKAIIMGLIKPTPWGACNIDLLSAMPAE